MGASDSKCKDGLSFTKNHAGTHCIKDITARGKVCPVMSRKKQDKNKI